MPQNYHHGVRVVEINEGSRPIRTVSTAVIGLVATANDADVSAFPLNTPVLISNYGQALAKAGKTGTLSRSLNAISQQCTPVTIVVRVEEDANPANQTANVVGTVTAEGKYTGAKALLTAQSLFGVKPRIIGAPGLDTQAVTTELVSIAQKLRAFVYASAYAAKTKDEALNYRKLFTQRELMVIWPDFVNIDSTGKNTVTAPAVAYALGLRAKIDNDTGWHKSISNVAVNGVLGINRDVFWDLQSPDTDAGVLNAAGVTTLINKNGFRFWGSRTAESGEFFYYENYTRTAQVLADTIAEVHFSFIDKPMHASIIRDIIESINAKFRELKTSGLIIDGRAWFNPEANDKTMLKNGRLIIDYDYTPVPPVEDLILQQRITDRYLAEFAQQLK